MPKPEQRRSTQAVLDRVEGDTAVLLFEDGSVAYVPASLLPVGAAVGSVVLLSLAKDRGERRRAHA